MSRSPKWGFEDKVVEPQTWINTEVCYWCGSPDRDERNFCADCTNGLPKLPPGREMTYDEREKELDFYYYGRGQVLMVPMDVLHGRLSAIVGCNLFTHQLIEAPALYQMHRSLG